MIDLLMTVFTGGATGLIGSIIGKAFSFMDFWVDEKKANNEHDRTIQLLELQNKLGAQEPRLTTMIFLLGMVACGLLMFFGLFALFLRSAL